MEKQLVQLKNNVKAYCKRVALLLVSAAFAGATLITVCGEAAKNVLPFKQVALSECTQEENRNALGTVQKEDYNTIQNHLVVAEALAVAGAVEPDYAVVEEKVTDVVAKSYTGLTASPVYADPSMNGYECIGTYLTTGYCPCAACCGKTNGVTASGVVAKANHTIAADTSVLGFGTQVVINGQVYTVEDRGGAIRGNRIDIYFSSHQEALNYGKKYVKVYRYVGTSENASSVVMETISETPDIVTVTTEAVKETTTGATTESTTEAVMPSTEASTGIQATTEATTEKSSAMSTEVTQTESQSEFGERNRR